MGNDFGRFIDDTIKHLYRWLLRFDDEQMRPFAACNFLDSALMRYNFIWKIQGRPAIFYISFIDHCPTLLKSWRERVRLLDVLWDLRVTRNFIRHQYLSTDPYI
jgi:hypothetical protein